MFENVQVYFIYICYSQSFQRNACVPHASAMLMCIEEFTFGGADERDSVCARHAQAQTVYLH